MSGSLYCPGCKRAVRADDSHMRISFTPVAAKLGSGGDFEWGPTWDSFNDYEHLDCGASVRCVTASVWSEEVGAYVLSPTGYLEITINGVYQDSADVINTEPTVAPNFLGISGFTGDTDGDPTIWGPTLETLTNLLVQALETAGFPHT